jgi:alkylation response protein AidB-like acyl-CoA dehydrogenase
MPSTDTSLVKTQEHAVLASALDTLCAGEMSAEYLTACDDTSEFPAEALASLAAAGWAGLAVPPEYGGTGASVAELAIAHAVIARHSLSVAQAYYSLWVLAADAISRLGSPEQQREWLPRIADGSALVGFALTEPGSGSDAAALRTRARRDGDYYYVSGSKVFITGAASADMLICAVRTTVAPARQAGISLLCIDPRAAGVSVRKLRKIGIRSLDLCEVFLDEVKVPVSAVLGQADEGWRLLGTGIAKERLLLAAICCGCIRDLLLRCTDYAKTRTAFNAPIGGFQLVADKIVRMQVDLTAAEAIVGTVADLVDAGGSVADRAAVAKLFASEAYVGATREAMQVFGGYGFVDDNPIARHYRDAKYMEIGGGTSEVQKIIIGRSLGLPL